MSGKDSSKPSLTDWKRLADPSDEGIDYSEVPPLDDSFFEQAAWRLPDHQEKVTLRLDKDVMAWFRSQGDQYQDRINAILRAYKRAHEAA